MESSEPEITNVSLHKSKTYLTKRYQRDKLPIRDIARECQVTERTIYNKLKEFGLMKK